MYVQRNYTERNTYTDLDSLMVLLVTMAGSIANNTGKITAVVLASGSSYRKLPGRLGSLKRPLRHAVNDDTCMPLGRLLRRRGVC